MDKIKASFIQNVKLEMVNSFPDSVWIIGSLVELVVKNIC